MKHRIYFFLLLALVIAVGYCSIDAAKLISDSSQPGSARLDRNTQDYGAVYISGEDAGFHPMDIVNNADNNSYYEFHYFTQYDFITKGCAAALIAVMSHYDTSAQMLPGTGDDLSNTLTVKNGFVYAEKFQYKNVRDETRYLDCILTASDFRIVYIRFYSDKEYDLTQEETDTALEEFDSSTMSFYYSLTHKITHENDFLETDYDLYEEDFGYTYDISDRQYLYNTCYDAFLDSYNQLLYIYTLNSSPEKFWIPTFYFSNTSFNCVNHYWFSAIGTRHILEKIIYSRRLSEPEYTTYQGMIYQSICFDRNELITIYNPAERTIEGFFTPNYGEAA